MIKTALVTFIAMTRLIPTLLLLLISNSFMTFAWYAHLYEKRLSTPGLVGLTLAILFSWGLAFFEYVFQVPANRLGSETHGGPLNLFQLKVIQEVITLVTFTAIAVWVFKAGKLTMNHAAAFVCLVLAVFFAFKK